MARGDMHKLLNVVRGQGLQTERREDSQGRTVWHAYQQNYMHNAETNTNESILTYMGKAVSLNYSPFLALFRIYNGEPCFYLVNSPVGDSPEGQRLKKVIVNAKAGNVRDEWRRYVVKPGDSLFDIAQRYYNDGSKWTKIAELNSIDQRTGLINPDDVLALPKEL